MQTAITSKPAGIALADVDPEAFGPHVERALDAGIPVVTYNADGKLKSEKKRLAYIGQDLFVAGQAMGQRIVDSVDSGTIALFIATPGQANIQPRVDGALDAIKRSGKGIKADVVATGAEVTEEVARVASYYDGNRDVKGMFAVDFGSTQGVARAAQKNGLKIPTGGWDIGPNVLKAIQAGNLGFTIDQQPYLQGFDPVAQLFFYNLSGGSTGLADENTGLKFVTKENVRVYNETKSRFEGDAKGRTDLSRQLRS